MRDDIRAASVGETLRWRSRATKLDDRRGSNPEEASELFRDLTKGGEKLNDVRCNTARPGQTAGARHCCPAGQKNNKSHLFELYCTVWVACLILMVFYLVWIFIVPYWASLLFFGFLGVGSTIATFDYISSKKQLSGTLQGLLISAFGTSSRSRLRFVIEQVIMWVMIATGGWMYTCLSKTSTTLFRKVLTGNHTYKIPLYLKYYAAF